MASLHSRGARHNPIYKQNPIFAAHFDGPSRKPPAFVTRQGGPSIETSPCTSGSYLWSGNPGTSLGSRGEASGALALVLSAARVIGATVSRLRNREHVGVRAGVPDEIPPLGR